jgi:hypothetical protein
MEAGPAWGRRLFAFFSVDNHSLKQNTLRSGSPLEMAGLLAFHLRADQDEEP